MMLRLSSGSFTALSAFRIASEPGTAPLGVGVGADMSQTYHTYGPSAAGHQLLLAGMRNEANGGVRQVGAHVTEPVHGVTDPRIEGPVGQEHQEEVSRGIDPELSAGETRMPVRGITDKPAEHARLRQVELRRIPAQQARSGLIAAGQEPLQRGGAYPLAIQPGAASQPDLRIPR